MHDERGVRAVPVAPRRSRDRQGRVHLLLLQPGPGARPGRLRQPAGAAAAEHGPGEDFEPVVRARAGSG